jgi:hypothetical protein
MTPRAVVRTDDEELLSSSAFPTDLAIGLRLLRT